MQQLMQTENVGILSTLEEEYRLDTIKRGKRDNTLKAYEIGKKLFEGAGYSIPAKPTEIVEWMEKLAADGLCVESVKLHLQGVRFAHELANLATGIQYNPCDDLRVSSTISALAQEHPHKPTQARALTEEEVLAMAATDLSPAGIRDRAAILLGFYGCLRRSEVVGIQIDDVEFRKEGMVITIPRAKTGVNQTVAIPCTMTNGACEAVQSLIDLLSQENIVGGAIFRARLPRVEIIDGQRVRVDRWADKPLSVDAYGKMLKTRAVAAGVDSDKLSGHSLRAGAATHLLSKEVPLERVVTHGRWTSPAMVVQRYYRPATQFTNNVWNGLL